MMESAQIQALPCKSMILLDKLFFAGPMYNSEKIGYNGSIK